MKPHYFFWLRTVNPLISLKMGGRRQLTLVNYYFRPVTRLSPMEKRNGWTPHNAALHARGDSALPNHSRSRIYAKTHGKHAPIHADCMKREKLPDAEDVRRDEGRAQMASMSKQMQEKMPPKYDEKCQIDTLHERAEPHGKP